MNTARRNMSIHVAHTPNSMVTEMKYVNAILRSLAAWAALSALAVSPAFAQEVSPSKPAGPEISADFPFESHYIEWQRI